MTLSNILVIGDLILDTYVFGDVERISPEAPIPVLKRSHKTVRLGGASNLAANIAGAGVDVDLLGIIGEDQNGDELMRLLEGFKVKTHLIRGSMETTNKVRVLSKNQQIVRIDSEMSPPSDLIKNPKCEFGLEI